MTIPKKLLQTRNTDLNTHLNTTASNWDIKTMSNGKGITELKNENCLDLHSTIHKCIGYRSLTLTL